MTEYINSNPDRVELLHMLGDPKINEEELLSLSNVFRAHIEATSRLSSSVLQSSETKKQAKESMETSLRSALDMGVDPTLVIRAKSLGIKAAEHYVKLDI